MKTVLIGICNSLMAASIRQILRGNPDFALMDAVEDGVPDIALLEVAFNPEFTVDDQLDRVRLMRSKNPQCRILLICDENSTPELARNVAKAKKDGLIDDFLYSSVSESYLTAMLYAI